MAYFGCGAGRGARRSQSAAPDLYQMKILHLIRSNQKPSMAVVRLVAWPHFRCQSVQCGSGPHIGNQVCAHACGWRGVEPQLEVIRQGPDRSGRSGPQVRRLFTDQVLPKSLCKVSTSAQCTWQGDAICGAGWALRRCCRSRLGCCQVCLQYWHCSQGL